MPITLLSLLDLLPSMRNLLEIETEEKKENFKKRLKDFVEHVTLGLSDQQLITGLAILTIGYTRHCTISSRHFWIVFDLSFFSAVTHLASLLALRSYFSKYRRLRDFRVFLMLCNYIMLLVAAILTFRDYNPMTRDCLIQCTFDRIRSKHLGVSGMYTTQMVLLTLAFFWQLVMMYMKDDAWEMRHDMILRALKADTPNGGNPKTYPDFLDRRNRALEDVKLHGKSWTRTVRDVVKLRHCRRIIYSWLWDMDKKYGGRDGHRGRKSYQFVQWAVLMLVAPPAAVVWLVILTLWALGVGRLVTDRQWAVRAENMWTFGQVLPMLIVVLPFFTVTEELQAEQKSPTPQEKALEPSTEEDSTHTGTPPGTSDSHNERDLLNQESMSPSERV
ncbi:hypothetical protein K432DRAFT_408781 [Lepidopterella palustris CBS 459.81]|uniref:Uncharacterized protein n=1 Tax=Lepidopterella palustris CBS 459.81 TaxID=1314670 RepID=A0A8E2E201_9PEZI|nr:hypothetical protein K432DRAFT_408781 [Lepidopterella palustris CBS 459.81]